MMNINFGLNKRNMWLFSGKKIVLFISSLNGIRKYAVLKFSHNVKL